MMKIVMLFLLGLISNQSAFAADVSGLKELFKSHFNEPFYKGGLTLRSQMTDKFIRLALSHGIDMSGSIFATLDRRGAWNDERPGVKFEFFTLHELRDSSRAFNFDENSNQKIFHSFLLADGYVFDFHFKNSPTVVTIDEYSKMMLIPKSKWKNPKYIENSLDSYRVRLYRVKQVHPADAQTLDISEMLEEAVPVEKPLLDLF